MSNLSFEPALINHVEFPVRDGERALRFYGAALAPLGLSLVITARTLHGRARYGLGRDGYPLIWFHESGTTNSPVHIAFTAVEREMVDAFHSAAIANGGTDNGGPGIRGRYHATYYAAYVFDPDGNNIEVVCQRRLAG
jgi:catechol 2,3-dioxygenase-like lactoylglutathione lyase family enzyme